MITVRPSSERGHGHRSWLDSYHTFAFADYYDPRHMGFRALRVINEDFIAGGGGFPIHPHADMEILTYVLEGALEHKDTLGNRGVIHRGEMQRITAGTGIEHSEFNASRVDPVHLFQIWILPETAGLAPGYEQRVFDLADMHDRLLLVASRDGRDDSITVHQDTALYAAHLSAGASVRHALAPGRHAWVQLASGTVTVNGQALHAGDGAAVSDEADLEIRADEPAQLLLFDLR